MATQPIQLYELAAVNTDIRFSPHCWKTRMALAHKGLPADRIPWCYSRKSDISFSGQGLVPVIRDGQVGVSDSWKIALYLEERFPELSSLFGGRAATSIVRFVNSWVDTVLLIAAARIVMLDTHDLMSAEDQRYFRRTREQRFGMSLEQLVSDRPAKVAQLRKELQPLRQMLGHQDFIGGAAPNYADYCVFGMFMWARCTSSANILEPDDPVFAWRDKLLRRFDNLARDAACAYPVSQARELRYTEQVSV